METSFHKEYTTEREKMESDKRAERFGILLNSEDERPKGISEYMPRAAGRFVDKDGISYRPLVILGIIAAGLAAVFVGMVIC
jgi:hypothetical protein